MILSDNLLQIAQGFPDGRGVAPKGNKSAGHITTGKGVMRKVSIFLLIALLIVISGCRKTIYTKPGATPADFERDKEICEYEAIKHGNVSSFWGDAGAIEQPLRQNDLLHRCMRIKGWYPVQQ